MMLTSRSIEFLCFAVFLLTVSAAQGSSDEKKNKCAGCPESVDVNDAKVQNLAKFSLSTLAGTTGTKGNLQLIKVTEAKKQVVSGILWHLTLDISNSAGKSKTCRVKVLEQLWVSPDPKVTDAECDDKPWDSSEESSEENKSSTEKVPILGGLKPINVNETKVLDYAKLSLSTLESSTGNSGKLQLVEVIEAYEQVVAGRLYHLTLKVSNSKGESKTCKVRVAEPVKSSNPEVIFAECEDKPLESSKKSSEDNKISTTEVPIFGGLKPISINETKVQNYAKLSISTLESSAGNGDKLQLVEVTEAYTQVVSGILYHLTLKVSNSKGESKTCKVRVAEPVKSSNPEVIFAECEDKPLESSKKSSEENKNSTEKVRIVGGLKSISINDTKVQNFAKLSLSSLESSSGNGDKLQLVEVTEAYSQVVAGSLYHLTLKVSNAKGESKTCKVKVAEQPWISPEPKVTFAECEDKPLESSKKSSEATDSATAPAPGGRTPISTNDTKVQAYAKLSLSTLESSSGTSDKLQLIEVTEAYQQVVAGTLYHLTLKVSNSKGESKTCNVQVLEQAGLVQGSTAEPKVIDAHC